MFNLLSLFRRNKDVAVSLTPPGSVPVTRVVLEYPEDYSLGSTTVLYQATDEEAIKKANTLPFIMSEFVRKKDFKQKSERNSDKPTLVELLDKAEKELGLIRQDDLDKDGKVVPAYRYFYSQSLIIGKVLEASNRYYRCFCAHYQDGKRSKLFDIANAYEVTTEENWLAGEAGKVSSVYNLSDDQLDRDQMDSIFWPKNLLDEESQSEFRVRYAYNKDKNVGYNVEREETVNNTYRKVLAVG